MHSVFERENMPAERQIGPNEQVMIAWKAWKESEAGKNAFKWMTRAQDIAGKPASMSPLSLRREGSMWAAFLAGWLARGELLLGENII